MTHADYVLLAGILAIQGEMDNRPTVVRVAKAIADAYQEAYLNFDRAEFLRMAKVSDRE